LVRSGVLPPPRTKTSSSRHWCDGQMRRSSNSWNVSMGQSAKHLKMPSVGSVNSDQHPFPRQSDRRRAFLPEASAGLPRCSEFPEKMWSEFTEPTGAKDGVALASAVTARHRRSGEKNDVAGVAHVAREFASIARNRSKPAFEREIGSPGSRRRDAKRSAHISASPEIALREVASSCSPASSRSRESSSIASLRSRTSIACAIRLPWVKKRL